MGVKIEIKELHKDLSECHECVLAIKTRQLKTPFLGLGNFNAEIMFIGERPGFQFTETGIVFTGNRSGVYFLEAMKRLELSFNQIYVTNIVKCQIHNNMTPTKEEINKCIKYTNREINIIQPKIIICLGKIAYDNLSHISNAHYIPHPSFCLRSGINIEDYVKKIKNVLTKSK